jgi:hypothetical protein
VIEVPEYGVANVDHQNPNRSRLLAMIVLVEVLGVCVRGTGALVEGRLHRASRLRQSSCRFHTALVRSSSFQQRDLEGSACA